MTPPTLANGTDAVGDGRQLDLYSGTETNDSLAQRGNTGRLYASGARSYLHMHTSRRIPRSTLTCLITLALHKWPLPVTVIVFFFFAVVIFIPSLLPLRLFLESALLLFPFSVHYILDVDFVPLAAVRRRFLNMESTVAD